MMNSTVKEIAGGKWWKVDFHVHTPASMDYGKESREPEKEKQVTPKEFLLKAIEYLDKLVLMKKCYLQQNLCRKLWK